MEKKRGTFSGNIGFVMAAAGSAVGLGNIWRFPYLAARHGGGLFLITYIILALTFGFTILTTEIAIGRKTKQGPLTAYKKVHPKFGGIGIIGWIVPIIILPYYCAIGGWVMKYMFTYITGGATEAAGDKYFVGFITSQWPPIIWMLIFVAITAIVVFCGVEKGIEKYSRVLMPILLVLIVAIAIFSLTLSSPDENGVERTGMEGLAVYVIPNLSDISFAEIRSVIMDAVGQLFYSISVAMGIMIAYGSYVKDDTNMMKSINQIEIFDTIVAILAGVMIVPAVYVFMGTEGMSAGPGLMFESLPKVFDAMGPIGPFVGAIFFIMVLFAAVTSSVSIMEAIVSGFMDKWKFTRKKSTGLTVTYALLIGLVVCLGYNIFYFDAILPTTPPGKSAQILDIMDYVSNSLLMPVVSLATCILIGWVVKPQYVIAEVTKNNEKFGRKGLFILMVKYIAPVFFLLMILQAFGL
ncbi:MAG: sodium-dependent transporter [Lachnospiraceae bacterium]|nr:sodium-dependent transporter [Lachnospiraceae bacterium]